MKQGFTLMELMVTVIIIGILASIAVPQYTKAVNKARLAEAVTNLSSLQKGIDMYCTQFRCNAKETVFLKTSGTRLDVDLQGSLNCDSDSCDSKNFSYTASCNTSNCSITITPISTFADYLPTLSATRTKTGLKVTWTRSCSGGAANMCSGLANAGF
ncbi:MAG: prepilin-type N-terminal cleavage/methylation domain-containing protein [Elusimicrobiaceae bacterium]|nr:prepilin-type N-terminal cleavage/methylation domain-containing protein [Elusimicrobiaceae bacterium]